MKPDPSQSLNPYRMAARIAAIVLFSLASLAPVSAFFRQDSSGPSPESRLASAVIAARDDRERRALVMAQPQLITPRFRHVLAMQVLRLQMKGDHQRVLATLDFARQLAEERKDKGWVAMTLIDSIGSYNLGGNVFKALAEFRKVPPLEELAHDRQALAHVLGVRAFLAREQGKNSAALQDALRSLELFDPEQKLEIALAHSVLGMVYVREAESEKAKEYLNKSLRLFEELGDRFWTAIPLNYLGEHYHYRGDEPAAINYLQRSIALSEEFGIGFLRYYTYNLLGQSYSEAGDGAKALLYLERGLAERETLGSKRLISKALKDLGMFYRARENYGKALEYLERSLRLAQETQYHEMASIAHRQIGLVWLELGEAETALASFRKALGEAQESEVPDEIGLSLQEIGRAYAQLGQEQQALAAWQQILAMPDHPGRHNYRGEILNNIANFHLRQNNLTEAENLFRQCLAGLNDAYRISHHHAALAGLGAVQFARADYAQASPLYERAYEMAETIHPGAAADYLVRIGEIRRLTGQDDQALESFRKAIELNEAQRVRISNPEWRSLYFARQRNHYELYLDLLMSLHRQRPDAGYAATAFQVSERARARSLLEMLTETRADIRTGVDDALLARERDLKLKLNSRAAQQAAPRGKKQLSPAQLAREIASLTAELKQVETQIRANSPRYAALTQPQPLSAAEVQKQVLDAGTLLLEYELGDKQSWLWAVAPDSLISFQLPPRAEIEAATTRFHQLLSLPERSPETETQSRAQAQTLRQLLLAPVATQLGQKRLVIVASGALQSLPFATLPETSGSDQPLIVNHEIINLPSASTLAVLRREMAGRQPANKNVAVLADPVFAANDARVKAGGKPSFLAQARTRDTSTDSATLNRPLRSSRATPERLFYSREEAEAIYNAAPAGTAYKALDFEANLATATGPELGQYRIIHFATHGLLNSEQPELSGLVLSLVDEKGQPRDGFLRLHEIYNLKLNADLVCLSACQTGLGKDINGEGLIGLTRGFMYAGAPRVVASLWKVDDLATSELMKRFYRNILQQKQSPAAALRAAQLEMSRQRRWQSPFYWAAFTIQGEWK